ncbi:uncharacterized protein V1513DRAFT_454312 [Lipomyces chichibuensis]|uniref:uncharacterized protein n=1 Tax=Lipomyces chichibuensis TaxID=1546026 RepID=UPI0033434E7B
MGQVASTQPSDDAIVDELLASGISAESSVAQASPSDQLLSDSLGDMDGELPITNDDLRGIANASSSASNGLSRRMPSSQDNSEDKELSCSSSVQRTSTNPSTRSRRISRHLSSLGLLQAQPRSSYSASDASAAPASSATAERLHSSFEPFRRRLSSSSSLASIHDTQSTRNSQSSGRRSIPTSTSRILGNSTSEAYSSSASVLRRRRESPTHEEQQERRNAARDFFRTRFSRVRNSLTSHPSTSSISSPRASTDHPSQDAPEVPSAHTSDISLVPEPTYVRRRPRPTAAITTTALSGERGTSPPGTRPSSPILAAPRRSSRVRSRAFGSTASDTTFSDFLESAGDEIMASAESSGRPRGTEDQAQVLSRLLSVAAAATAASLVGGSTSQLLSRASPGSRRGSRTRASGSLGDDATDELVSTRDILNHDGDGFGDEEDRSADASANTSQRGLSGEAGGNNVVDGTFSEFLRSLQTGRLAQELRQESAGGNRDGSGPGELVPPLNFFRMFRFPSEAVNASHNNNSNSTAGENNGGSGRMIPVIIVGIRSVHSRGQAHANDLAADILPTMADAQATTDGAGGRRRRRSDASTDYTDNGSSAVRQRRGGLFDEDVELDEGDDNDDEIDENDDEDEENHDSDEDYHTEDDEDEDEEDVASIIETDESRASGGRQSRSHTTLDNADDGDEQDDDHMSMYSRRRGSRTRSGSADGNATGGRLPDADRSGASGGANNVRSWIIYVLGGQYPENHPILTTPSLFTDNPTYEDMLLLSSFIGPAKPPVATQDDIDRSGGIFEASEENLGERCLVCLSDFEEGEECRKLRQCGHLFHKKCIDEWLTTGRNSCPLCRAPGVAEGKNNTLSSNVTAAAAN